MTRRSARQLLLLITTWVRKRRRSELSRSLFLSALSLVTGACFLFLCFCLFYVLVNMCAPALRQRELSLLWPGALTLATATALFIDSLHSRRDDFDNIVLWLLRESFGLGPRLILESWRLASRAWEWGRMDVEVIAHVLTWLAAKPRSVPSTELLRAFPGFAWAKVFSQLRLVPGVLFLRRDFSRITLSGPLRASLRSLLVTIHTAPPPEPEPQPAPEVEPEKLSPHEILGVAPDASPLEIKTAYRLRMKECHPDRFPGMDDTARASAEEWTKALNAAYAALQKRY